MLSLAVDSDDRLEATTTEMLSAPNLPENQPIGEDSPTSSTYLYEAVDSPPTSRILSTLLQLFCQNP